MLFVLGKITDGKIHCPKCGFANPVLSRVGESEDDSEDDLVDEDNLDLDEDELDFGEEDAESGLPMFADLHGGHSASDRLEILPLDEADLPLICYIVVDRIEKLRMPGVRAVPEMSRDFH